MIMWLTSHDPKEIQCTYVQELTAMTCMVQNAWIHTVLYIMFICFSISWDVAIGNRNDAIMGGDVVIIAL